MVFEHINKLYIVRSTLRNIIKIRGYTLPDVIENETLQSLESAYTTNKENGEEPFDLSFMCTRNKIYRDTDRIGDLLMVFFHEDINKPNVGIAPIREYVKMMTEKKCMTAIMVVKDGLTSPANSMLRDLEARGIYIVAFSEMDLLVDIYQHERVPKHVLLTTAQKNKLLQQFHIQEDNLPKIQKQDPMAKYMGLLIGDVVRIHRISMTVANDIYYRIVVDSEDLF